MPHRNATKFIRPQAVAALKQEAKSGAAFMTSWWKPPSSATSNRRGTGLGASDLAAHLCHLHQLLALVGLAVGALSLTKHADIAADGLGSPLVVSRNHDDTHTLQVRLV